MRGEDGEYLPFTGFLTSESVKEIAAYIEAAANDLPAESRRQFERLGAISLPTAKRVSRASPCSTARLR